MDLASWPLEPGVTPSEHVRYGRRGRLGLIVLDRPKAINSLTLDMVSSVLAQLALWRDDDGVGVVAVTGTGERGLCAGGDVVAVRRGVLEGGDATIGALSFFQAEYGMNRAIAHYPKPFVALIEGVTMGGGVGIACHGSVRLADPDAKVAMPESIIGFFPDVGVRHLLAGCPGGLGVHLAMTGDTVSGADAVRLGLADAAVPSARFAEILDLYAEGAAPLPSELGDDHPASELVDDHGWIDECYQGDDAAAVLARLRAHPDPRAAAAADAIEARSPLAVCVGLAGVRAAQRARDVDDVLDADLILARAMAQDADFAEGVRAQLVDKDRAPSWRHQHVSDVPAAEVVALFQGRVPARV